MLGKLTVRIFTNRTDRLLNAGRFVTALAGTQTQFHVASALAGAVVLIILGDPVRGRVVMRIGITKRHVLTLDRLTENTENRAVIVIDKLIRAAARASVDLFHILAVGNNLTVELANM